MASEVKFKIGDRVSVAAVDEHLLKPMRGKGTVVEVLKKPFFASKKMGELLRINMDSWDPPGISHFHPKQCRLLKKKERRRIWVDLRIDTGTSPYKVVSDVYNTGFTEFIEVKRK